jgi:beta-ketodecanoyl-[acyl-carrier-protein] synthase
MPIAITGTGLFTPPYSISNEELVTAFNAFVDAENERNAAAIARAKRRSSNARRPSSSRARRVSAAAT